ncbi:MAG TPA: Hpt domain-containing protein [Caulobacter sp.]|nr:Hpt domain-containing protein [Caulobacter sp.]
MSDNSTVQVIQTPNVLKLKVGGRFGGIDAAAIAKAEAALKSLSGNFAQWMNDELTKLEDARAKVHDEGLNKATAELLYLRAHDLKGLGATYEFPIVTRIAGSLCKLIDDEDKRLTAPMVLIDAHINGIKAAVRSDIRDESHPVGRKLAEELEAQVRNYTA